MKHRAIPAVCLSVLLAAIASALAGCPPPSATPVQKGLDYLANAQVAGPNDTVIPFTNEIDFPGDWPQFATLVQVPAVRFRDLSPFIPSLIHHSLSVINDDTGDDLGLTMIDLAKASKMRTASMDFMLRFASRDDALDAGTYGFWPYRRDTPPELLWLQQWLVSFAGFVPLYGDRGPINFPILSPREAIPTDSDVTANIYACILDDAMLDRGPGVNEAIGHGFSDWRDLGVIFRRNNPDWMPAATGAFLTWFSYRDPPDPTLPNDVDIVVNANVLYALGRYGELDTPGAVQAITLINVAIARGVQHERSSNAALYYLDNFALDYCISRAYGEGGVHALAPAVEILAADIEEMAIVGANVAHWERGSPSLSTALAMLTLMNAGRTGPLLDKAAAYLVALQDPVTGAWPEEPFFRGTADSGIELRWGSSSYTTAVAIEALCRLQLLRSN